MTRFAKSERRVRGFDAAVEFGGGKSISPFGGSGERSAGGS